MLPTEVSLIQKLVTATNLSQEQIEATGVKEEQYASIYRLIMIQNNTRYKCIKNHLLHKYGVGSLQIEVWDLKALSGDIELYKGMKKNYTLAHYAAASGSIDALEWIKENNPDYLKGRRSIGESIAHSALLSRDATTIKWVAQNVPTMLFTTGRWGSLIDYALRLEDPNVLNCALSVLPQSNCLIIPAELYTLSLNTNTISQALDTNYMLTEIKSSRIPSNPPERMTFRLELQIEEKLKRNKAIQEALKEIQKHEGSELSEQQLKDKFFLMLPEGISPEKQNALFETVRKKTYAMKGLIDDQLNELKEYCTANNTFVPSLSLYYSTDTKIEALYALRQIVLDFETADESESLLNEKFNSWLNTYKAVIDEKENISSLLYASFWQATPTSTRVLVNQLKSLIPNVARTAASTLA